MAWLIQTFIPQEFKLSSLYLLASPFIFALRGTLEDPLGSSHRPPHPSRQDLWPGFPLRCSPVPSIILLLSRWFRVGAVSRRAPNSQVRLSLPSGEATAMAPGARIPPLKTAPARPRVERPGEGTHSHFCPLTPGHTDSAGGRGRIQSAPGSLFSPDPTLPGDCLPSGPVTESSKGHSTCPFIQQLLSGEGCGKTRESRGHKSIAFLHML